jgi:hypothetical protein
VAARERRSLPCEVPKHSTFFNALWAIWNPFQNSSATPVVTESEPPMAHADAGAAP